MIDVIEGKKQARFVNIGVVVVTTANVDLLKGKHILYQGYCGIRHVVGGGGAPAYVGADEGVELTVDVDVDVDLAVKVAVAVDAAVDVAVGGVASARRAGA